MKISTTALDKIKLIAFILILVATVAVNAVTVSIIVRHYTADNAISPENKAENAPGKVPVISDETQSPVFGAPEKIILHGDGKAVTLMTEDEDFEEILKINEHRTVYVKEYQKSGLFDENTIDAYYMEFVYGKPHMLKLNGAGEYEVSSIIFVLTGVNHGKMKFNAGGEAQAVEKLSFDPELLVKVIDHLE